MNLVLVTCGWISSFRSFLNVLPVKSTVCLFFVGPEATPQNNIKVVFRVGGVRFLYSRHLVWHKKVHPEMT